MLIFNRNKLREEITELEAKKSQLIADNGKLKQANDDITRNIDAAKSQYDELTGRINIIETKQDYGIPFYDLGISDLEEKRYYIQKDMDVAIGKGLYKIIMPYTLDNSTSKGKELQNAIGAGMSYAICAYIADKERGLTTENLKNRKELIIKKFDYYQKKAEKVGIALNSTYVKKRMEIMGVNLSIKLKYKAEKAALREEKRRLREQEQLLAEIAKEEARLERERKAMDVAFAKALTDDERAAIKGDMAKIDKRLDNLRYRREHNKAGWLYVISSPSLPGMVKVGCTRQLNPVMRVKQLSSSSLPYAFRTHGFVFSDDCFELESAMHHYFDDRRVAPDREFFNITPKEAIDVLENKFGVEVHFVDCDEESEDDNGED